MHNMNILWGVLGFNIVLLIVVFIPGKKKGGKR